MKLFFSGKETIFCGSCPEGAFWEAFERKICLILQPQKMKLNGWFFMLLEDRYGERPARVDAKDFLNSFFLSSFF